MWTATVAAIGPDGKYCDSEEIDVEAPTEAEARRLVKADLAANYESGLVLVTIDERVGGVSRVVFR